MSGPVEYLQGDLLRVARMWNALGDSKQTFAALRALTAGLLYGPTRIEGVREFAARTGALVA
ncbi:hypothetical protein [Streptomyces sp. NPDC001165]|uniref:hypothetical protein n=1 Tax=Streptomyces sp. NPDC001165 TaxID=3364546 RepID=UPI0036B0CECE